MRLNHRRHHRRHHRLGAPLRLVLALALLGIVHLAGANSAAAYPQFQFSTYAARCNLCHFSPSGGGLINGFGRGEAGETISRGGNGEFLHGLWTPPDFLALGLDLRGAGVFKDNATEPQLLGFPMQAELYGRVAFAGVSANVILGMRGAARDIPPGAGEERSPLDRLASREHYLMYETGYWYVRAGRYHAPYGIYTQDHSEYIRRYLGRHTLEETYNLSGGYVADEYEWHATVFGPAPVFVLSGNEYLENAPVGGERVGGTFYYENRNDGQNGSFGAQARADITDGLSRYWVGGLYKRFYEQQKLMLLSQLDVGVGMLDSSIDADPQVLLSAHLGLSYLLTQGVMVNAIVERYDPDVLLSSRARDAASLTVQYFPYAHFELHLIGRMEFQGQDYAAPAPSGLLMLHYYL
jgi:hypothetical protein